MNDLFEGCGGVFSLLFGSHDMLPTINPASGLPVVGSTNSGLDVAGNPYGIDYSTWMGGGSFPGD